MNWKKIKKKSLLSPFRSNWCDWDSCMWVPDKETIYEEAIEAKKEGADLKFSIKLSVRHRAVFNKERDLTWSSFHWHP